MKGFFENDKDTRFVYITSPENIEEKEMNDLVLEQEIGSGISARVFLASWKTQYVAVKMARYREAPGYGKTNWFSREVECLTLLSGCPNVPQILESGRTTIGQDKFIFIVMTLVNGLIPPNFFRDVGKEEFMVRKRLARTALGIFSALEKMHSVGFAHGDLCNPNNVIITSNSAVLVDFGFARLKCSERDKKNDILCAASICSLLLYPEEWKGEDYALELMKEKNNRRFPKILMECLKNNEEDRPTAAEVVVALKKLV